MTVRLGLDASLRVPSCAVSGGGEIALATAVGRPVENFPEVIREALRQAGLQLGDVDEFVACVGPGSYMGVRSAVVTANALALAVDRPVTGVLSVDALVVTAPAHPAPTVAVPAGRGRWFVATYRWAGELLQRDGLPRLVDQAGAGAWRASEQNTDTTDGIQLSAHGAVLVAERHRHLATETCRREIAPHLPPASIGSRR
jgi:tRNA threonylcarbamoyl adenosine modification protein YeaZ